MTEAKQPDERGDKEEINAAAGAFSQISGLLGGFSVTVIVLVLSTEIITDNAARDWVIALFMLAAGGYVASASVFANAISYRKIGQKWDLYTFAFLLFHGSNILLALSLVVLVFQFPLTVARAVAIIITLFIGLSATINFWSLRSKNSTH